MKHEYIDYQDLGYPIGIHISSNTPMIKKSIMEFAARELDPVNIDSKFANENYFNVIVTGSSGTICGAIMCDIISEYRPDSNVRLIYIKKEGEYNHHLEGFKGYPEGVNIFVDDFTNSGATVKSTYKNVVEDFSIKYPKLKFKFDYAVFCGYALKTAVDNIKKAGVKIDKMYYHKICR